MNTLQNRLKQIKLKNKENQFKHRINVISRKGAKITQIKNFHYKSFLFNGNLHSNKIEKEKFTNYVSSFESSYYKILQEIFNKLYKDDYDFFKEFQLEENNYSEISNETQRLNRIIKEVNNIEKIPKINEMIPVRYLKQKEKRYKGIRLFVHIRENGYIELYLIDLYHLGINAYNATTGNYDLNRNYNSNKNYKKCISKIADEYKKL